MNSAVRLLLLITGFLSLSVLNYVDADNVLVTVISDLLWPFCFLACSRCSHRFAEFGLTCLAFISGLIIRFLGFFNDIITSIAVFAAIGLLVSFVFLIDMKLQRRRERKGFGYGFLATLMFPITWMTVFSLSYFAKFGTPLRLSFYFFDCKILSQSLSVIGGYGLDFLMLWTASVSVYLLFGRPDEKTSSKNINVFLVVVLLWAAVFTYGSVRLVLASYDEESPTIKVAYGTGLYSGDYINFYPTEYDSNFEAFESLVRQAYEGGASVLVTNEEAYLVSDEQLPGFLEIAKQRAKQYKLHMLLAFDVYDDDSENPGKNVNKIVWISDKGRILCEYDKKSLIPFIETGEYESTLTDLPNFTARIDGKDVKICCAICYDSNFSNYLSSMDDDTDILILPSWDWTGVTQFHFRIAGGAGIENGVAVLKPTYDGVSYCGDLYGNIIKVNDTNETGYVKAQFVDMPVEGKATPYGAIGEYLHWVCPVLFAVLLFI